MEFLPKILPSIQDEGRFYNPWHRLPRTQLHFAERFDRKRMEASPGTDCPSRQRRGRNAGPDMRRSPVRASTRPELAKVTFRKVRGPAFHGQSSGTRAPRGEAARAMLPSTASDADRKATPTDNGFPTNDGTFW